MKSRGICHFRLIFYLRVMAFYLLRYFIQISNQRLNQIVIYGIVPRFNLPIITFLLRSVLNNLIENKVLTNSLRPELGLF